jgi:integrase
MTNADLGQLSKDMVDLDNGTLTRRRVKTGDIENVPTVCYKLWAETLQLLKQEWSSHSILVLTSTDGTSLYATSFEGNHTRRKDLIVKAWSKAEATIPFKAFRSISATTLESHETFGRLVQHFLGHAPQSVKDRHYAAPSQELFNRALSWLHDQIFS